jgi:cytochrome c oxidase cbb3-type subunit 2
MRVGPDLANLATRKPPYDAEDLMTLLYAGTPQHPSYKFLFENKAIVGQRSDRALKLGSKFAPPAGYQVVPTERAQVLVAYLLSLNNSYAYPEESARNTVVVSSEAHKEPAAKAHDEKAPATPAKPQEGAHK